jgi:hypothetical protein
MTDPLLAVKHFKIKRKAKHKETIEKLNETVATKQNKLLSFRDWQSVQISPRWWLLMMKGDEKRWWFYSLIHYWLIQSFRVKKRTQAETTFLILLRTVSTEESTAQMLPTHKVLTYREHHSVCPLVGIGTPPPL